MQKKLTPIIDALKEAEPDQSKTVSSSDGGLVYDPYNERIKLYGLGAEETRQVMDACLLEDLAGKITVYGTEGETDRWNQLGFRKEAVIKGFYRGNDAHIWAAYPQSERARTPHCQLHDDSVRLAQAKPLVISTELPEGYCCEVSTPEDSPEISQLLVQTFEDYPTPIESALIEEQIRVQANHFRVVRDPQGEVAAVASAEIDHAKASAEMTDCATRADLRGQGLMNHLLARLEQDLVQQFGIDDLYTLARADEVGMNCVFSKLGYQYSGRLDNNCRMPNGWESMNVWCRKAQKAELTAEFIPA